MGTMNHVIQVYIFGALNDVPFTQLFIDWLHDFFKTTVMFIFVIVQIQIYLKIGFKMLLKNKPKMLKLGLVQ